MVRTGDAAAEALEDYLMDLRGYRVLPGVLGTEEVDTVHASTDQFSVGSSLRLRLKAVLLVGAGARTDQLARSTRLRQRKDAAASGDVDRQRGAPFVLHRAGR